MSCIIVNSIILSRNKSKPSEQTGSYLKCIHLGVNVLLAAVALFMAKHILINY